MYKALKMDQQTRRTNNNCWFLIKSLSNVKTSVANVLIIPNTRVIVDGSLLDGVLAKVTASEANKKNIKIL